MLVNTRIGIYEGSFFLGNLNDVDEKREEKNHSYESLVVSFRCMLIHVIIPMR